MPRNFFQRVAYLNRCQPQFIIFLQILPDIRSRAESPAKAQGRVAGNSTFASYDLSKPVRRHAQLFRQLVGTLARLFFTIVPLLLFLNDLFQI